MRSKEIIKRVIAHDNPPRFGFNFKTNSDFISVPSRRQINLPENPYEKWGEYPELKKLTGFNGETYRDFYGNIYGRFNGKTKGECIMGAIKDWDGYIFPMPEYDPSYREALLQRELGSHEKFVIARGSSLFSTLRDARLMANALMDTIEYPDEAAAFVNEIADREVKVIKSIAGCGIDGWMISDDLGMQNTAFISPSVFRELFKPAYKKLADAVHEAGMSMIMHSCGYIYSIIYDLIDAGIDVFQFDQPDAYPTELLAQEFAQKVVFYSPVDIQKVLPTGNREYIELRAMEMCNAFRSAGGGWIAKDYPAYADIGVDPEWALWAQNIITANSKLV